MPQTRTFQCYDCRHEWTVPYGTGRPLECPACRSQNFCRAEAEQGLGGCRAGAGARQMCRRGRAKP